MAKTEEEGARLKAKSEGGTGAWRDAFQVMEKGKLKMKGQDGEKRILSLMVDNEPGVLSRIAGLFSGRGFNIESLCVAATTDPLVSRITLVTLGDSGVVEQIKKQLNKLINVIKVLDFTGIAFVQREMALVKVRAKPEHRAEILRMVDIFRSKVVDVGTEFYTIEVTGAEDKIEAFLSLLKPMGIKEIARTGAIALAREKQRQEASNGKD
jgi:acetolactate synthase-1/3 small subunit